MEPQTVQEFITAAKAAVIAGDLAKAKTYSDQAQALKALELLDVPAPAAVPAPVQRLPFEPATVTAAAQALDGAAKSWFVGRFGALGPGIDQVAHELYGNYEAVAHAKNLDFRKFLRSGLSQNGLDKTVVLTPTQLVEAVATGVEVSQIKATMLEASDILGGYVVPEDFRTDIIQRLPGLTVVRAMANVLTTSSDRVLLPKATGGDNRYISAARISWVDESPTSNVSATSATWGNVPIPVHTMLAKLSLTRSLMEDAAFDVLAYLSKQFAIGMAINEDEQFLVGTGAGKPQGILLGVGANAGPFDADTVTQVLTSGNATALTADKVVATPYQLAAQYRQNAAKWVFNKNTAATIRQLKDAQNRYFWENYFTNFATTNGNGSALLGYEVKESEAMPTIAANTYPIIFGDFSGYTIVDRIGMSVERYMDSTTADTNSVVFYARRRLGGQVTEGWKFAPMKIAP